MIEATLSPDVPPFARALAHHDDRAVAGDPDWYELLAGTVLDKRCRVLWCASTRTGVALLPCTVRRRALGTVLESLGNYYLPDYRALCSTPAAVACVPALLREAVRCSGARRALFHDLDRHAAETQALIDGFARLGWAVRIRPGAANWTQCVASGVEPWLAARPSRLRNTLQRRGRRFAAEPGARLQVLRNATGAALAPMIAAYEAVYAASWKTPEPYPAFVPALMRQLARRGELRLGVAWLHERPIAAQCWSVRGGTAFVYKLAHDASAKRYSAGSLLFEALAREVIEVDGVVRLDFLSGDDAYKRDWMDHRDTKLELEAFDPRSPAALVGLARYTLSRLRADVRDGTRTGTRIGRRDGTREHGRRNEHGS